MDGAHGERMPLARAGHADRRRVLGGLLGGVLGGSVARGRVAARPAKQEFAATFEGQFAITEEVAESPLFVVEESGTGSEAMLADFTYTAVVRQNLARVPEGCGPNSSTGVGGTAVLTFDDGALKLRRTGGTACFAFPHLTIAEEWTIASGTERFAGASGKLARHGIGDVRFGSIAGTLQGTLKIGKSRAVGSSGGYSGRRRKPSLPPAGG